MERFQVYDACAVCKQYDDLAKWKEIAYVCNECYNKLDGYSIRHHAANAEVFRKVQEKHNGKTPA